MLTVDDGSPAILPVDDLAVALGPPAATATLPAGIRSTLAEGGRDPHALGVVQFVLILSDRPATKTYRLGANGRPDKAADPFLSEGTVYRASLSGAAPLSEWAGVLDNMPSDGVLMCGTLAGPRDTAPLTTKERLASRPGAIARTKDCAIYPAGRPGLAMIDHDAKDVPHELRERVAAAGGLDAVLASICPEFGRACAWSRGRSPA